MTVEGKEIEALLRYLTGTLEQTNRRLGATLVRLQEGERRSLELVRSEGLPDTLYAPGVKPRPRTARHANQTPLLDLLRSMERVRSSLRQGKSEGRPADLAPEGAGRQAADPVSAPHG